MVNVEALLGKLTEEETIELVVSAISQVSYQRIDELVNSILAGVPKDFLQELVAQLEEQL